jgi:chemotaxis protein CheD
MQTTTMTRPPMLSTKNPSSAGASAGFAAAARAESAWKVGASAATQAGAPVAIAQIQRSGAQGEASHTYFERAFNRSAVKVLPGEFFVSSQDILLNTVLGSCVSACIWDCKAQVGGMNHFMLPDSSEGDGGASGRYGGFAMELLVNELMKRGARKASMQAKVFGGGAVLRGITSINVGEKNSEFVREFLATEGIRIVGEDLLDIYPRKVMFYPSSGKALVKKLTSGLDEVTAAERSYQQSISVKPVAGDVELF